MEVSLEILHGRLKSGAGVQKVGAFTIRQPRFVIGRAPDCNMVCKSSLVSLRHCEIKLGDQTATLEDLNSEHGTFINGVRIEGRRNLKSGDMLAIGRLEFFVSVDPGQHIDSANATPLAKTDKVARNTVAMSAPTSETVADMPSPPASSRKTDGIDDLVSDLLREADEKDRESRMSDPDARYLRVESPDPSLSQSEELSPDSQRLESKQTRFKRPERKRPIKLPADKLPRPPSITGKDSVNAAEKALEELLRTPKK